MYKQVNILTYPDPILEYGYSDIPLHETPELCLHKKQGRKTKMKLVAKCLHLFVITMRQ